MALAELTLLKLLIAGQILFSITMVVVIFLLFKWFKKEMKKKDEVSISEEEAEKVLKET